MTWTEILQVSYKTVICYFFLIIILKIMGKREIGKVSTFDIVVFFVISELFSLSLNEPSNSILHSLLPIGIIVILQLITAFISLKSRKLRDIMEGKPTFIIYNGEIIQKTMTKERYNIDDLFSQLRAKNVQLPSEVQFAILEDNGLLEIILKKDCILRDPEPVISDGEIIKERLKRANYSEEKLLEILKRNGYDDYKEIFLALLTIDGLFVVLKEKTSDTKSIDRYIRDDGN